MGIVEQPTAFYLDRAVYRFGSRIDGELAAADDGKRNANQVKMARTMILRKWLGPRVGGFAEPKMRGSGDG